MRNLFITLFVLCSFSGLAQQHLIAGIQPAGPTIDTADMYRFMSLLELDANKYTISSKFKDYNCNIIISEYRQGKLVNSYNVRDSLKKTAPNFDYTFMIDGEENEKFEVALYSQKVGDSLLKIYSIVGKMAFNYKLKLDKNSGYSWKEVFNQPSKKHELKTGELYPLLTYSRAVSGEHSRIEGATEFCKISGELIPFENWYRDLGIEHYFIVFIRLEK